MRNLYLLPLFANVHCVVRTWMGLLSFEAAQDSRESQRLPGMKNFMELCLCLKRQRWAVHPEQPACLLCAQLSVPAVAGEKGQGLCVARAANGSYTSHHLLPLWRKRHLPSVSQERRMRRSCAFRADSRQEAASGVVAVKCESPSENVRGSSTDRATYRDQIQPGVLKCRYTRGRSSLLSLQSLDPGFYPLTVTQESCYACRC